MKYLTKKSLRDIIGGILKSLLRYPETADFLDEIKGLWDINLPFQGGLSFSVRVILLFHQKNKE